MLTIAVGRVPSTLRVVYVDVCLLTRRRPEALVQYGWVMLFLLQVQRPTVHS